MESLSNLYNDPQSDPVGHAYAFVGAKGGVGSSTICHNVAWTISEMMKQSVVIADLDLPFGTAGLDFNQDPMQGIADAIATPERLDEVLLDRLLTKCSEYLSIFAAPGVLDREYDLSADACDLVLDVVRQNVPYVALDVPHMWTEWTKRLVLNADNVIITAAPDLANLRNAKNMFDLIKQARNNDKPPMLVLSTVGMPKRPEISIKDFEAAMGTKAAAIIEFDCETFGQAANNGQMIEELTPKSKAVQPFHDIAMALTGRREQKAEKAKALGGILQKLRRKR
jgi:pilus assembly protein CpaE